MVHEPLKKTILVTCIEIPPRRLKLIFTPHPANPASLRLEMYSLGLFGKMPLRGIILIFTPAPKESNKKVLQEPLKMTILDPSDEILPRRLKPYFPPDPAKPAILRLEMYSLGHFEKPPSRGFILILTPGQKQSNTKEIQYMSH